MKSYKLTKARLRYIIPFQYDIDNQNFEGVCSLVESYIDYPYSYLGVKNESSPAHWVRKSLQEGEQDVYDYIVDEFTDVSELDFSSKVEKRGLYWSYRSLDSDKKWKTPMELKYRSRSRQGEIEHTVLITDMGLYVFRSGVGFLWYEVDFEKLGIKDSKALVYFQNVFKELNRGNNRPLWINRSNINLPEELNGDEWVPFLLGNWIAERLEFLGVTYQAQRHNSAASMICSNYYGDKNSKAYHDNLLKLRERLPKYCPDKALIFTYAAFERDDDWQMDREAVRTAYYLTNGYKESYEMSDVVNDVIRKPFSNVIWSASREGCGYYVWYGSTNYKFFTGIQDRKIINDYFLLYIRTIYQSFSLMRYSVYTSETLPNDYATYLQVSDKTEEISDRISKISAEISLFMVKSIATSISHIQHQNEFYEYLNNRLQIKEDAASVTAGLAALNELQLETADKKKAAEDRIRQEELKEQEEREKQADNSFQVGLGLMSFLVLISALTDGYGVIDNIANGALTGGAEIAFWILFAVCVAFFVLAIWLCRKTWRNLIFKGSKTKKTKRNT